ncbi:putative integral membrane protein [Flammeovirgaceae bacterium 311]|nr:putative integral membrane protein [Flammeovirgaceae bacterium 311]
MEYLFGDAYGLIHLISSIVALVTGTLVLIMKKGTTQHRQIGYVYVASMGILILTAFMIYRLFNGWGIFHYTTVMIFLTIGLGMIPIWIKKPAGKWRYMHFSFMYWSVIGLYSAFVAEVLTRIPKSSFFGMVGISFGVIMLIGGVFFVSNKSKWSKLFSIKN